jgi:hypothetical protein
MQRDGTPTDQLTQRSELDRNTHTDWNFTPWIIGELHSDAVTGTARLASMIDSPRGHGPFDTHTGRS